ncbi:PriCT-2 domain-containing protein [Pandoraea communis]|uniref:PriCT-2 domain-containing protein n=1 Tax=Pandoraea communis TaxID=2508297 RepID=UPI0020C4EA7B|nr:PriCT-2 domain-containing protein [Pandoraea communis]
MALKSEFGDEGEPMFHEWSQRADNYDASASSRCGAASRVVASPSARLSTRRHSEALTRRGSRLPYRSRAMRNAVSTPSARPVCSKRKPRPRSVTKPSQRMRPRYGR